MNIVKLTSILFLLWAHTAQTQAQQVDYSVVRVNEEASLNLTKITGDNDYVCMPIVKRNSRGVNWLSNKIIAISKDGNSLAYLSARNNTTNIFIKELGKQGSSIQRTNRKSVLDFSYSPDGANIVFSEAIGNTNQIFQTSSTTGYVCRQITTGSQDYSPAYTRDAKHIVFARQEQKSVSLWSYDVANNYLSSITPGMNPCPMGSNSVLCTRVNGEGRGEIWKINYETGLEECILSDTERSFTTPSISPDGKWILCVGSNALDAGNGKQYYNTDIFVCKIDGSHLQQLTYHATDDLSPTWSKDGQNIYFISQRGSENGTANVWCMNFSY